MSRKLSKSHKNKISNAMKGRSLSEEQKAKLRISMKGINTWAKGRTVSQKTKDKLSSIRKGKKRNPFSEETKEKMKQAKLRNPIKYWQGKKRPSPSIETKKRRFAARSFVSRTTKLTGTATALNENPRRLPASGSMPC